MRYLTLNEVLQLYRQVIGQSGGAAGVRDLGALKSALSQPGMSFSGEDLYPTVIDKAAILGFSIVMNHPFVDGNKRTGHAAMEVFLVFNGYEVDATVDEQEKIMLELSAGEVDRKGFTDWLRTHVKPR